MFRKSLIVVAVLVAAGSANAGGFSFGFSSHGHSRGHVHVERRPMVVRHYRPVYRYRAYPPSQSVYGMPYPVYMGAPQPTYYVSAPAPAPVVAQSAPVVNNITTNVNVQGDANTVSVGATAAQGSTAAAPSQVIWQKGMRTGTTHDFKWLDPRTGVVMEVDVDHETGVIEDIEED